MKSEYFIYLTLNLLRRIAKGILYSFVSLILILLSTIAIFIAIFILVFIPNLFILSVINVAVALLFQKIINNDNNVNKFKPSISNNRLSVSFLLNIFKIFFDLTGNRIFTDSKVMFRSHLEPIITYLFTYLFKFNFNHYKKIHKDDQIQEIHFIHNNRIGQLKAGKYTNKSQVPNYFSNPFHNLALNKISALQIKSFFSEYSQSYILKIRNGRIAIDNNDKPYCRSNGNINKGLVSSDCDVTIDFVFEKIDFFRSKVQRLNQTNKKKIREKDDSNYRFTIRKSDNSSLYEQIVAYENNIIFELEQNVLLEKEINVFDQEMNDLEEEINVLEEEIKLALDIIKSENETEKIKLKTFCNEVADFSKLFPTAYDIGIRQIPYLQTNKPRSPGRPPTYLNMGQTAYDIAQTYSQQISKSKIRL